MTPDRNSRPNFCQSREPDEPSSGRPHDRLPWRWPWIVAVGILLSLTSIAVILIWRVEPSETFSFDRPADLSETTNLPSTLLEKSVAYQTDCENDCETRCCSNECWDDSIDDCSDDCVERCADDCIEACRENIAACLQDASSYRTAF